MANLHPITCRRCRGTFVLPDRIFLPACPHCGASPGKRLSRLRNNRFAAVVATVALITLTAALTMPFMDMTTLGQRREFSLLGGIKQLFDDSHYLLAAILFIFSVVFPVAKLVSLLIATSGLVRISIRARRMLHKLADLTGKYSILDVLVVAVLIVLIKFRNVAEVHPRVGVTAFCAAVALSILAGLCVSLPEPDSPEMGASGSNQNDETQNPKQTRMRKPE